MPFLLRGAMRVTVSLPCLGERWSPLAFGVLGGGNTCLFPDSASTSASSMRLFFERFLIALKQALSDPETGISVGRIAHLALWAQDKRGSYGVPLLRLASMVAHDQAMTAVTFPTGVARIHTGGDDLLLPRLIPGVAENAALHPIGAFGIAPARILALFGLEIAQMLEDENARCVLGCELDNTSAHQMRHVLISVSDLTPEGGVVLFVFRHHASLRSVACNTSKRTLPKARYLCATADKTGGQDGAFDSLDGANGNMLIDIQIDGADPCIRAGDLLCYLGWRGEGLFDGGMQPELLAMPDQLGASQRVSFGQVTPQCADFDPGPARSGPDFEHETMVLPVLPLPRVERSRFIPGPGRDGRALWKRLLLRALSELFRFVLLLAHSPLFQVREEGASRAKCRIDGGAAKHGRDIWRESAQWHDGCRVRLCGMGEPFQGRERLFVGESKDARVCLDTIEVEGDDAIEEGGILRKALSMLRLIVQRRSYRAGRLRHVCFLLAPCATAIGEYSITRTRFQPPKGARQARAQAGTRLPTG